MEPAKKLRTLLREEGVLIAPGAYDALSARAIEQAGFPLMGTTGYGIHGSVLGVPDNGQMSFKEMLDVVTNIVAATTLPVLADAEGGYGNAINTVRTVRMFEQAGLAGLFLEDQRFPPNCPFVKDTEVISVEEMCGKIRAAADTRKNPDFLIIARSDAPYDEAIERAEEYRKAGADMIKIIPKNRKELEDLPKRVKLPLHLGFMSGKDINRGLTAFDAGKMGYKIVTFPMTCLFTASFAMQQALKHLYISGSDDGLLPEMLNFESYAELVGAGYFRNIEQKYITAD